MSALATALAHHQAGRLPEAEAIYRTVLAEQPDNIDALHLLGVLARQARQPIVAVKLIGQAIALNDGVCEFHNNLGTALLDTGQIDGAKKAFLRALQLRPRYADAMLNLANLLVRTEQEEAAITCYRAVLRLQPENADAASNLGVALRRSGAVEEAIDSFRLAAELRPTHADAHYNLGNALLASDRPEEAIEAYQAALTVRPDHAESHYNLGNAFSRLDHLEPAIEAFMRALELNPSYVEACNNLGRALQCLGRFEDALECFDRALALAPEHGDIHYNKALLLLLLGCREEGWAEHEWRWKASGFTSPRRNFKEPAWDGTPNPDATLLVHAEQGLGDSVQFIRYLAAARERVGGLLLEAPTALHPLLREMPFIDGLVSTGESMMPCDAQVPLLSLPYLLGEEAGQNVPYLVPDPALVPKWSKRLSPKGKRIGLVWAGNPKHGNDRNRSMSLQMLSPVLAHDARFFSFQLAPRSRDLAEAGLGDRVTDLSSELTSFAETAAALMSIDLLITVDTAVAHVAGALGRPVWLMLPFAPDWRWGATGQATRWYPHMRLFRQANPGRWEPVVAQIAAELKALKLS